MKPSIVNWIYLALGFLLLDNVQNVVFVLRNMATTMSYYPILPFIKVVAAVIAIIGLVKVASWSRMLAFIVIGIGAIEPLAMSLFMYFNYEPVKNDLLNPFLIVYFLFLFLAYKLYSSEQLKQYLRSSTQTST